MATRSWRPPAQDEPTPFGGGYFPGVERGESLNLVIAFGHWLFVTTSPVCFCGWVPWWIVDWAHELRADGVRVPRARAGPEGYLSLLPPLTDGTASEIIRLLKAETEAEAASPSLSVG